MTGAIVKGILSTVAIVGAAVLSHHIEEERRRTDRAIAQAALEAHSKRMAEAAIRAAEDAARVEFEFKH